MITILICTDDAISKKIVKEYLDRDSLSYVNMLDNVTYEEAVKAVEVLEKSGEKEPPLEPETKTDLTEHGWIPVAITEECLKPSDNELLVIVGYKKDVHGTMKYCSEMLSFNPKFLKEYIEKHSLEIIKEAEFNKRFRK